MTYIETSTSEVTTPTLSGATFQELRSVVAGEILAPSDDGYAQAAKVWNGAYDGLRPAVVVRCKGATDVAAAIVLARRNELTVAVRGGGHSVAGFSTGDGVMVFDLSPMNDVHVDAAARRARVGGGAVWPTSTATPSVTRWPPRAGLSPPPAWPASPWAAASAG